MKIKVLKITFVPFLLLLVNIAMMAQDKNGDKEVIIIEKTIDQDGNVISKSVKRNQGNYTEDQLNDLIEEDEHPMLRSFDMEGMGFGDLEGFFGASTHQKRKATLGVFIAHENGQAIISEVVLHSGAAEADIRVGDKLISIEKVPVVTIEEIKEAVGDKKAGDEVDVVVWRDGSELEKIVKLGGNSESVFGDIFDHPGNSTFRFFGEDGGMPMDADSIMRMFQGMGVEMFDFGGNDMQGLFERRATNDGPVIEDEGRPQLGVFIEDRKGSIIVTEVIPNSAAAIAGLKVGDSIERIDDNRVSSFRELKSWMNTKSIGDETFLTISRKGRESQKKLILK
ncbi:MAG: putative metalloprotease with PDZ domain [Saprospiraceae bacterium]|jgi:predicted metalloprotease with PDZ domain